MNIKKIFSHILHWHWREKYIKESHFILILSFITGILTAFTSIFLKKIIHFLQYFLKNKIIIHIEWLYFIYPAIGILLSGLFVKYIVKDDIGHGVTNILYAISQRKSRLKIHNLWTSLVASSITIGFGGSVGAEAPSVLTGSAIGSNLGRLFKMEQKTLMLLIGCGAAGAIAGVFKAPIAGLLFTIEVLMLDLTTTSVLPLLISSITAASISYLFTGTESMFKFNQTIAHNLKNVPYVLLLGVICGLITVYFARMLIWIESIFSRLKHYWQRFTLGAFILSILVFFFHPLYGEGYDFISDLISNQHDQIFNNTLIFGINPFKWSILFFIFVIFTKVFATGATTGSGGCGGIFAPSLFLGCVVGFVFSHSFNYLLGGNILPEDNFSLIGMAGMMSAILHAPLTAIFLIAELTGGFDLFLPLMIVSSSAYFTILFFEKYSIHSIRLAQKGKLLTHDKDRAVLNFLHINTLIEIDFQLVYPNMTLGDMVKVIARSNRSIYPVIDNNGILQGIVLWDNIRNIMFRPELYERFNVERFMISPWAEIRDDMSMDEIMCLFEDSKAWNLPIVDKERHYLGMISKSKIFNAYRDVLQKNFAED